MNNEEQKRIQEIQNRYKNFNINSNQKNSRNNYQSQNTSYEEFKRQKEEQQSVYRENIYEREKNNSSGMSLGAAIFIIILTLFIIGTTSAYYLGAFDSFKKENIQTQIQKQTENASDNFEIEKNEESKISNKNIEQEEKEEIKTKVVEDEWQISNIKVIYDKNNWKNSHILISDDENLCSNNLSQCKILLNNKLLKLRLNKNNVVSQNGINFIRLDFFPEELNLLKSGKNTFQFYNLKKESEIKAFLIDKNKLRDKYKVEIKYKKDEYGDNELYKVIFYKNNTIYKTIENKKPIFNDDYIKSHTYIWHYIIYSPNHKYFAINTVKEMYEGGESIQVDIYNKDGKYLWHASGPQRAITFLSNNGKYFIHTSDPGGACYDECRYTYITRRYGEDLKLAGGVEYPYKPNPLTNGKLTMTLTTQEGKQNYVELDETGGLIIGNLWIEKKNNVNEDYIYRNGIKFSKIDDSVLYYHFMDEGKKPLIETGSKIVLHGQIYDKNDKIEKDYFSPLKIDDKPTAQIFVEKGLYSKVMMIAKNEEGYVIFEVVNIDGTGDDITYAD